MRKPILTIAIPTYNRSNNLKECLDHICPQLTDEVTLIVRDNCSNNYDFDEFIRPYNDNYGVVSKKNKTNIGADANIARLYEDCETKWLWVIGDDDFIKENIVSWVLSTLKEQNDNVIYVKFNGPYVGRTIGINEFAMAMKPRGGFGSSFFTSEFVSNVEKTRDYLFWHYKYLSTYCGQILRVIQYLLEHEEGECLFLSENVLLTHGGDVTWSHFAMVKYQLLIYDIFHEYKSLFNNNIFKEIASYCLVYVDSSNVNWRVKWYYYRQFVLKFGLFNLLRYNYVQVFRIPLRILFTQKIYNGIKNIFRR